MAVKLLFLNCRQFILKAIIKVKSKAKTQYETHLKNESKRNGLKARGKIRNVKD